LSIAQAPQPEGGGVSLSKIHHSDQQIEHMETRRREDTLRSIALILMIVGFVGVLNILQVFYARMWPVGGQILLLPVGIALWYGGERWAHRVSSILIGLAVLAVVAVAAMVTATFLVQWEWVTASLEYGTVPMFWIHNILIAGFWVAALVIMARLIRAQAGARAADGAA
jgi:hypothetical protein